MWGVDQHDGAVRHGVDEVRGELGRVLVGPEDHLDRVGGAAEARALVGRGEHGHVGDVAAVRRAELDEGVGDLAGGEPGEFGLDVAGA